MAAAQQHHHQFGRGSAAVLPEHRPKLLQRPVSTEAQRGSGHEAGSQANRTAKEREEDYNKARQRIIGEPASSASSAALSPLGAAAGMGGSGGGAMGGGRGNGGGGRYMGGSRGGGMAPGGGFQGGGFRGRGRKPGRGDRSAELQQDPDYMRGTHRCCGV